MGGSSRVGDFAPMDSAGEHLFGLYDKIGRTKKIGISYSSNTVTAVTAGLAAETHGVQPKWKISEVQCTTRWKGGA